MCVAGVSALHVLASIQADLLLQTIFHIPGPNGDDIAVKPVVFADNHAEHTQRAGEILDIEHAARLKRRRQHRQSLSMGGDEGTIHRPRSGVMLGPPAPSRCQTAEEIPSSLSLLTVYRRHLSPRPFRAVPGRSTRVAALRACIAHAQCRPSIPFRPWWPCP